MRNIRALMDEWFSAFTGRDDSARPLSLAIDNYEAARERMVAEQMSGGGRKISNQAVLATMRKVPRHEFVPEKHRNAAYEDRPLPIGHGQTISQPYIVAFMTEQLNPKPSERILEIGTGSGYQTAVLAELAKEVFSIEVVSELAERAKATLRRLGYANIHQRCGDGAQGWPEAAPFHGIIGTCAPDNIPETLIGQLAEGGRMVIPVGAAGRQQVWMLRKQRGKIQSQSILPVQFVPMVGSVSKN